MKILKSVLCGLAIAGLMGLATGPAAVADPGDEVVTINVPVPSSSGLGIGIAADCDGNLFYTNSYDPTLFKMDATGADLGSVPITKASDGSPVSIGEIAWDDTRQLLWGGTDDEIPAAVYLIDPVTGVATFQFNIVSRTFDFIDGIAFDGTDNTVWVSDDVSDAIDHFDAASGAHLGTLTPKNAAGGTLGLISGVLVGTNNTLYVGRNGEGEIVRVDKSTGDFISGFATVGGRDEGLECDVINFAPLTVVWSKDAYDNTVSAIEVEDGTCACGGGGLVADLDIKPQSCPNPLNVKFKGGPTISSAGGHNPAGAGGVLPVAILGTDEFDVNDVDVSTVELEGVAPLRSNLYDVATPVEDGEECECTTEGADGYTDLTLKFNKSDIIDAIGAVSNGDVIALTLTGTLLDGTEFTASDCVVIRAIGQDGADASLLAASAENGLTVWNQPNPFNAGTTINYLMTESGNVSLTVYNVLGQEVTTLVDGRQEAGSHKVEWNGRNEAGHDVASGVYLYRLQVNERALTRKMMLLK